MAKKLLGKHYDWIWENREEDLHKSLNERLKELEEKGEHVHDITMTRRINGELAQIIHFKKSYSSKKNITETIITRIETMIKIGFVPIEYFFKS